MAISITDLKKQTSTLFGSRTALLFPGQGAQEVGMGLDLYEKSPAARRLFQEADQATGISLTKIVFEGPADELQRTINSQPAILSVSLACLAAVQEQIDGPVSSHVAFVAGHSLGEYTALAAAGVLDAAEAVWLVRERGRLMQEACDQNPGTMAAILGLDEPVVAEVCKDADVQMANINAPGQIVVSGERAGVEKAGELARSRGAKRVIPLSVSGAFHSHLMGPALNGMIKAVEAVHFRNPTVPIIANCTSKPLTSAADVKEELIQQLCGCVRWQDGISYMVNAGTACFFELGPGRVLTGMVKRIAENVRVANVSDIASLEGLLSES